MNSCCPLYIDLEKNITPSAQIISDHLAWLPIPVTMNIGVLDQFIVLDHLHKLLLTDKVVGVSFTLSWAWRPCGDRRNHIKIRASFLQRFDYAVFPRARWRCKNKKESLLGGRRF